MNCQLVSSAQVTVQFANEEVVNNEDNSLMIFELVLYGPVGSPFAVEVCIQFYSK